MRETVTGQQVAQPHDRYDGDDDDDDDEFKLKQYKILLSKIMRRFPRKIRAV
jgi:hypothetical protein